MAARPAIGPSTTTAWTRRIWAGSPAIKITWALLRWTWAARPRLGGRSFYDSCMALGELAGIAAQLYALPFDEFVAGRTAVAKELLAATPATPELRSRAAEVRSLPKPSVGAWAINMLAWQRPETLRAVAELGLAMRQAQDALDAATLRSLTQERRKVLAGAVAEARSVAQQQGRTIRPIAAEVETNPACCHRRRGRGRCGPERPPAPGALR